MRLIGSKNKSRTSNKPGATGLLSKPEHVGAPAEMNDNGHSNARPGSDEPTPAIDLFASSPNAASSDETVVGHVLAPKVPSAGSPQITGEGRPPVQGHDRFATGEIAIVCSNYEFGRIHSVREFRRGSRQAPKVVLETAMGMVLIKRRQPGRASSAHIAFSHAIQHHLERRAYPLARLITGKNGQGAVTIEGFVYEAFEFITGTRYDRSLPPTADAGRALAYFHRLLSDYDGPGTPVSGSYHNVHKIPEALRRMAGRLNDPAIAPTTERLASMYERASARVRDTGIAGWPRQVIHADFHPGNLIYADGLVRAVVDFDSARIGPRALDIANAAMQFSVTRTGLDPMAWPVALDAERLAAFLGAYDAVEGCILSRAECKALPGLMVEALITEATLPIAATGRFGQIEGSTFLRMVERKASWMLESYDELIPL